MKAFLFAITGALIATQLHAAELRAAAMRTDVAAATAGHSQLMSGRVAHATLTTAVVDREPVDRDLGAAGATDTVVPRCESVERDLDARELAPRLANEIPQ